MNNGIGIIAFGGYVPPLRLSRKEVSDAHAWVNPRLRAFSEGERSAAGWDEDTVTMAVEAARDCLSDIDRASLYGLVLGTTSPPFADRLNSGIVAAALGLAEEVIAVDMTGSERAGTAALNSALDAAIAHRRPVLVGAAERRKVPAATQAELTTGHGAAALVVGSGPVVARLIGSASLTVDFISHFRENRADFDYHWEERWIREEGYLKIVPRAIEAALANAGIAASTVSRFCLPSAHPSLARQVAKLVGITEQNTQDDLLMACGETGAAHTLMMLVRTLEHAHPGDKILAVSFGSGSDAFLFEVTQEITRYKAKRTGIGKWLDRRSHLAYLRYLALNDMLKIDYGIRAEADKGSALSAMYRHRDLLTALVGGRCVTCGTHQIPRQRICVNPDCLGRDSQVPHSFAESSATVVSWSADQLTYTPDPPAYYGMVDFSEGGRLMMDFTNIHNDAVQVGMPMRMVFRIKDYDHARGFVRYFWKAAPAITE